MNSWVDYHCSQKSAKPFPSTHRPFVAIYQPASAPVFPFFASSPFPFILCHSLTDTGSSFFSPVFSCTQFLTPPARKTTSWTAVYEQPTMSRRDNRGARSLHCRGYNIHRIGERELRQAFSAFGKVIDVYLPKDYFTKVLRGFAYIQFENDDDADASRAKLDRTDVFQDDHMVNIMWAAGDRKTPTDMRRLDIERDNPHARREVDHRRGGDRPPERHRDERERDWERPREDGRPRYGFGGRAPRQHSRSPPRRRGNSNDRYSNGPDAPPMRRHQDHFDRRSVSPNQSSRKRTRESPNRAPSDPGRRDPYRGRSRSRSRSPVRRRTNRGYRAEEDRPRGDRDRDRGADRNRGRDAIRHGENFNGVKGDSEVRRYSAMDDDDRRYPKAGDEDRRFPKDEEDDRPPLKGEEDDRILMKDDDDDRPISKAEDDVLDKSKGEHHDQVNSKGDDDELPNSTTDDVERSYTKSEEEDRPMNHEEDGSAPKNDEDDAGRFTKPE